MANVNFDAAVNGGGAHSTNKTWSHTCGTSALLLVAVNVDGNDTGVTTSATYNGVAMTALGGKIEAYTGGGGFLQLYYSLTPASGANTVSISCSTSVGSLLGVSISFVPGTGYTLGLGTPVTANTGAISPISVATTTGTTGNLVAAFLAAGINITAVTIGTSGAINNFQGGSGDFTGNAAAAYNTSTSAGASVTWSVSSAASYAALAVEVQATGSGAPAGVATGTFSAVATGSVILPITAAASATFAATATGTVVSLPATYRLFPSTSGPSAATSLSGNYSAATGFHVTSDGLYLSGYWWWVASTNSPPTGPQKCCLWQDTGAAAGHVVSVATVTSGTLSPGWNFIALPTPVALSKDGDYRAVTGVNGNFPTTTNQYGAGQPFAAGITNGPLQAYSDTGGSLPSHFNNGQCSFQTANADPAAVFPASSSTSANRWIDMQVQNTAPPNVSYRLWPNFTPNVALNSQTNGYTFGTQFVLSATCTLNNIWFYSAAGAPVLPARCAIWDESTGLVVPGTDNATPTWSGAAGSGWVSCSYSTITLPPGHYRVSVFYGGGQQWYAVTTSYWTTGVGSASGISTGPLTAPNNASATSPGQSVYNNAAIWSYPNLWSVAGNGENYWIDVEVTPLVPPGGAASFTFTATANGVATYSATGSAVATFVATSAATWAIPAGGTASATFTATATGSFSSNGAGTASATFTALAVGTWVTPSASAGAGFVFSASATGGVHYFVTAAAGFSFGASAGSALGLSASGTASFSLTATAAVPLKTYTFTPPVIYEVPTDNVDTDHPAMSRLMQYYRPRERGVSVYKMDDGTYWVSRQVPLLNGPGIVFAEPWPPLPVADQVNNVINTAWLYSRVVSQTVQTPGVVTVYYGGHSYQVTAVEAAAMTAAGLGNYVTVTAPS